MVEVITIKNTKQIDNTSTHDNDDNGSNSTAIEYAVEQLTQTNNLILKP